MRSGNPHRDVVVGRAGALAWFAAMVEHLSTGECYWSHSRELRLVLDVSVGVVTYAVLFTAGGWTTQGPPEMIPLSQFLGEAASEVKCPPIIARPWP
jgi:hypothetical protein